jgi:hypothetical protein
MTLALLDASPVGGGPVARALARAAQETGGEYVAVRVYDLLCTVCSGCGACLGNGRCSRRHVGLDDAIRAVARADALLVGASGHVHAADPRARALVERLAGAFAHVETRRGLSEGRGESACSRRRAALVCSASPLLGLPAMFGILPAGLDRVWSLLERGGVDVMACESVDPRWSGPAAWDRTNAIAQRLGRALSAQRPGRRAPTPRRIVPLPAPVAMAAARTA